MSIVYITGPAKSGKTLLASALRNNAIALGNSALLLDEDQTGEAKPLVEKLLAGVPLPAQVPADLGSLPWKKNPMVIVIGGEGGKKLQEIEALLPGFMKQMGLVFRIKTEVAG